MKKEGEGGSLKSDLRKIEKLAKDKTSLKRHLKVTRHNNGVLKNVVEELKTKNGEIEGHLQETKAKIESGNIENAFLKKKNEELKIKAEKLQEERDLETNKRVKCQSENVTNLKMILELKATDTKLTSELEDCKKTDADLVISEQELKECNEKLEAEVKQNLLCASEKKTCEVETDIKNEEIQELRSKNAKVTSELESGSAEHIITKHELHDCEEELEDEIQKNKNLQIANSKSLKALEGSRSSALSSQRRAQECKNQLEDELEVKEELEKKLESVCPSWSEWNDCSKTCNGVKTRFDKCSMNDNEIEACNYGQCRKFQSNDYFKFYPSSSHLV